MVSETIIIFKFITIQFINLFVIKHVNLTELLLRRNSCYSYTKVLLNDCSLYIKLTPTTKFNCLFVHYYHRQYLFFT